MKQWKERIILSAAMVALLVGASFVSPTYGLVWVTNTDPSTVGVPGVPKYQFAIRTDVPSLYYKTGSGITDFAQVGVNSSTVTTIINDANWSALFGDGNDGDLTYDGASVVLGVSPVFVAGVGNIYPIDRTIYAHDVTLTTTGGNATLLQMRGGRLFGTGTLTFNTNTYLTQNGGDGNTSTNNNGAPGGVGATVVLDITNATKGGGTGGNASGGAGTAGGASTTSFYNAANTPGGQLCGGSGGANGGGAAGTSGPTCTPNAGGISNCRNIDMAMTLLNAQNGRPEFGSGGSGGRGSVSATGGAGGGGGSAGGVVVSFHTIVRNGCHTQGCIQAHGGSGGNGNQTGGNAGGGGGGAGGIITLVYQTGPTFSVNTTPYFSTETPGLTGVNIAGGKGGLGGTTLAPAGSNGMNGGPGATYIFKLGT